MTLRLVVGFVKHLCDLDDIKGFMNSEEKALYELRRAPPPGFEGLISIVRKIRHLNAVFVDVDSNSLGSFLLACKNWDPVDYCDENARLTPVESYAETVPVAYQLGTDLRTILANEHSVVFGAAHPLGLGVRIGLIDSGVAPHPYLPSLSAKELQYKLSTVHSMIPKGDRRRFCDQIETCEKQSGVDGVGVDSVSGHNPPLTPNAKPTPIYDYSSLGRNLESEFASYHSSKWKSWKQDISNWLGQQRRGIKPSIPAFRHPAGQLRLFSPHSRNFVQSARSSGIMDAHGHGTRMAGIFSALRPTVSTAEAEKQFNGTSDHPLMQPVNGICPYAELVILKCFHKQDPDDDELLNGSLLDMVEALEYAVDLRLDVLYIGLAAYDLTFPAGQSVIDLLGELRSKGTVVIAPAGNKGATRPELAFPAGVGSVKAVTAVFRDEDSGQIERCEYSARASKSHRQRVAFCAIGGTQEMPIVTTNRGSGFEGVAGTSVAAAIAASLYGAAASSNYRKQLSREYDLLVGQTGQIDVDLVETKMCDWIESQSNRDLLSEAMDKACLGVNGSTPRNPSEEFGVGIVRMLGDHLIP